MEEYIRRAGPFALWEALFGCHPEDTDVLQGEESHGAAMIEEVLQGVEASGLSPVSIGFSDNRTQDITPGTLALLRTKIMSGVVLSATSARSARNAAEVGDHADWESMAAGIFCVIGQLDEMDSVLPQIYADVPAKVTRRLKSLPSPPAIRTSGGKPCIEIRLRAPEQLCAFLNDMVEAAVKGVLERAYESTPLYRLPETDVSYFPEELVRLEEDDVERINAIAEHCGDRIDAEGCSLKRAFSSSPFRRTLVQNLIDRITSIFSDEMARYGAVRNGNILSLDVPTGNDLGPVLYRLFGDPSFELEGLLCQEIAHGVSITLPEIPEAAPETFLLPPKQSLLSEFFMSHGGADACLCMWETENEIPDRYYDECGPIHSVVPVNAASVQGAVEEISGIFQRDAFGAIE
ncbi:hypothetical protein [Salipiger mucosus]|uniref:Uncharacterized protein n=1 Tax=Salipiger mucosus DSM 16094 TaxID=1123237 RepID=S9QRN4_9RHOB|nr:hypothetical protein [Salipiger mucosus]EPX84046.1 hypothetical protein Salmuc_01821 [Salipiger mucosus DSM 16094]